MFSEKVERVCIVLCTNQIVIKVFIFRLVCTFFIHDAQLKTVLFYSVGTVKVSLTGSEINYTRIKYSLRTITVNNNVTPYCVP